MTKSIELNRTDTAISGVSALNLPMAVLNFPVDFTIRDRGPKEAILTNLTSPLGCAETIRFAVNDIANIYKGTNIDPTLWATTKHGVNVLAQVNDIWSIVDSTNATFRQDIPFSAHIVLKVPDCGLITADMLKTSVGRLADALFNSGVVTSERLGALAKGALIPSGVD